MGTAIKHFVPDRVKPSFVNFDTRTLSDAQHGRQSAQMSVSQCTKKLDKNLTQVMWHHSYQIFHSNTSRKYYTNI